MGFNRSIESERTIFLSILVTSPRSILRISRLIEYQRMALLFILVRSYRSMMRFCRLIEYKRTTFLYTLVKSPRSMMRFIVSIEYKRTVFLSILVRYEGEANSRYSCVSYVLPILSPSQSSFSVMIRLDNTHIPYKYKLRRENNYPWNILVENILLKRDQYEGIAQRSYFYTFNNRVSWSLCMLCRQWTRENIVNEQEKISISSLTVHLSMEEMPTCSP